MACFAGGQADAAGMHGKSLRLGGSLVMRMCVVGDCANDEVPVPILKLYVGNKDVYDYDESKDGTVYTIGKRYKIDDFFQKILAKKNKLTVLLVSQEPWGPLNLDINFIPNGNRCKIKVNARVNGLKARVSLDHSKYTCEVFEGNIYAK
ncbi:MAG: hypothetical protein GY947_20320 [Rhodobacteraceae bacterium]|nr:hypothetical protein [Paracoccaceae bacterium]